MGLISLFKLFFRGTFKSLYYFLRLIRVRWFWLLLMGILFTISLLPSIKTSLQEHSVIPLVKDVGHRLAYSFNKIGESFGIMSKGGTSNVLNGLLNLGGVLSTIFWLFALPVYIVRFVNPNVGAFWPIFFTTIVYIIIIIAIAGYDPIHSLYNGFTSFFNNTEKVANTTNQLKNLSNIIS